MNDLINSDYQKKPDSVRQRFERAAGNYDHSAALQTTVADRLFESLDQMALTPVNILDLGSGTGYGCRQLKQRYKKANYYQLDLSTAMLSQARSQAPRFFSKNHFVCADANQISFPDNYFDLLVSNLMLQWCDDLETVFAEVRRVLRPGGLFLFSSFGPDTLMELRESWQQVDEQVHVNLFVDMHDIGDGMMRNGLEGPVLSIEHVVMTYDSCRQLMQDLKKIGATNINNGRRKTLTGKHRLNSMIQHYETFRCDEKLPATYEVIYGHAWAREMSNVRSDQQSEQTISISDLKQQLQSKRSS